MVNVKERFGDRWSEPRIIAVVAALFIQVFTFLFGSIGLSGVRSVNRDYSDLASSKLYSSAGPFLKAIYSVHPVAALAMGAFLPFILAAWAIAHLIFMTSSSSTRKPFSIGLLISEIIMSGAHIMLAIIGFGEVENWGCKMLAGYVDPENHPNTRYHSEKIRCDYVKATFSTMSMAGACWAIALGCHLLIASMIFIKDNKGARQRTGGDATYVNEPPRHNGGDEEIAASIPVEMDPVHTRGKN